MNKDIDDIGEWDSFWSTEDLAGALR